MLNGQRTFRFVLTTVFLITQFYHGSATDSSTDVKPRYMDVGGVIVPDANDLLQQPMPPVVVNPYASISQIQNSGGYMQMSSQMSPQMYPPAGYMEPYIDNSIFAHISATAHFISSFIKLGVNTFGIVPASLYIGYSPPPYVKQMMLRRESLDLAEYYNKLVSIVSADIVGFNNVMSSLPLINLMYSLIKNVISVPTYIVQKIIATIQDFFYLFGF